MQTQTQTQTQRLADQESNWRRPRSPALAIPGAAVTAGKPYASNHNISKSVGTNGSGGGGWAHFRRAGNHNKAAPLDSGFVASYDAANRDASTADNWRAHASEGSGKSSQTAPAHAHRKHMGFVASSNAAEVARRAFVASEIGSIGKAAGSGASTGGHKQRQHSPDKSSLQPAVPLRPLYVHGFQTPDQEDRKEDWAVTPTSTLPSLPTSPIKRDLSRDSQPQSSPRSIVQRRVESHDALVGNRNANGSASGLVRLPARAHLSHDANGPSPLNPAVVRAGNANFALPSPKRAPLSFGTTPPTATDGVRANLGQAPTSSSPRRPTENLGRFRKSVDSPQSQQRNGSPAYLGPTRKGSHASLSSTSGHPLSHSRRDSTASSNFSSPSTASIISSRPAYGVYRPPHLRNRNSTNGLQTSVAHYDRVRTPSLRGYLRSPEPPSRPGSTQPLSSGDRLGPDWSPRLSDVGLESPVHLDSPVQHHRPHHHMLEQSLKEESTEELVDSPPRPLHDNLDDDASEELNLSHEAMMQVKTSLTDSYCMSRRSSMMSNFRVGNGVPVVDIFQVGDRLGPGMIHDGYPITIAETSDGFRKQQGDVTGTRLEVIKKLGEGSYAVVYLVQEVAGDGQVIVGPKDDVGATEGMRQRGQPIAGAGGEEEGDLTLADTTLPAGTLTDREPREGLLSSTLRAKKPGGDSFATRVAAEAAAAAAQEGEKAAAVDPITGDQPLLSGLGQPQEGRLFALKCLCKRDLSDEMLEVQRLEATIHQSLPPHANIVTLYRTYETSEWLFLVLEYCPGQDLYYWLEQAQDTNGDLTALSSPHASGTSTPLSDADGTPPSPSLLASTAGTALLSRRRLKLISKMFRQMCEAVQFCHDRGISHRDIKPENFIVEDRRGEAEGEAGQEDEDGFSVATEDLPEDLVHEGNEDKTSPRRPPSSRGRPSFASSSRRRVSTVSTSTTHSVDTTVTALAKSSRVVVKLTDFGLATAEPHCRDFDCGSKPYMAYECRNNVTSYYDAQQADIWSLGIVLLNLVFHRNPFKEPSMEKCESFTAYCYDPIGFLTESFEGLTAEMAEWLSTKVLCNVVPKREDGALPGNDDGEVAPLKRRVSAREFGEWTRDLPQRFGLRAGQTHKPLRRGGASVIHTSPMAHSRCGSDSSTLPSMLSSPHFTSAPRPDFGGGGVGSGLVVEEGDDAGMGGRSLFPEYDGRRGSTSYVPPKTPDILPSPTFPSSPRQPFEERDSPSPLPKGTTSQPPRVVVHSQDKDDGTARDHKGRCESGEVPTKPVDREKMSTLTRMLESAKLAVGGGG